MLRRWNDVYQCVMCAITHTHHKQTQTHARLTEFFVLSHIDSSHTIWPFSCSSYSKSHKRCNVLTLRLLCNGVRSYCAPGRICMLRMPRIDNRINKVESRTFGQQLRQNAEERMFGTSRFILFGCFSFVPDAYRYYLINPFLKLSFLIGYT